MKKYTCPCCGYKTYDEVPGNYEICPTCYWEDDPLQFENPDMAGGANNVSLRQEQKNYLTFGVCEQKFVDKVRKPTARDKKDINWQSLDTQK